MAKQRAKYQHLAAATVAGRLLVSSNVIGSSNDVANALAMLGAATHGTFDILTVNEYITFIRDHSTASEGDLPAKFQVDGSKYDAEAHHVVFDVLKQAPTKADPGAALPQGITGGAATGIAHDAVSSVESVGHFLGELSNPHLWLRVGEVVLGLAVLIVGVDQMLKLGAVQKAGKAVATGALL